MLGHFNVSYTDLHFSKQIVILFVILMLKCLIRSWKSYYKNCYLTFN